MEAQALKRALGFWVIGMIAVIMHSVFELTGKPAVFAGTFAVMIWIVAVYTMVRPMFKQDEEVR